MFDVPALPLTLLPTLLPTLLSRPLLPLLLPGLGLLAAALGAWTTVPQIIRIRRTRTSTGVSAGAAVLSAMTSLAWLGYGIVRADLVQLLANVVGVVGSLAVTTLVLRHSGGRVLPAATGILGWAAVVVGLTAAGRVDLVTAAATTIAVLRNLPQVRLALRRGVDLLPLSPAGLAIGTVSSGCWVVYGFGVHQGAVWSTALAGTAGGLLVLARRCPPRRVVRTLHRGRWGLAGRLMVAPLVPVLGV